MKDIIEKIKKLLALSESANQHEAELAAQKAQEMLAKHNLTIDAIDFDASGTEAIDKELFIFRGTMKKWRNELMQEVAVSVGCDVIYHFEKNVIKSASIYGLDQNVKTAVYIYMYLENTINRLRKEFIKRANKDHKDKYGKPLDLNQRYHLEKSYTLGIVSSVSLKLEEQKVKTPPTPGALVVVVGALIERKMNEDHPSSRQIRDRAADIDCEAYGKGEEDGENITISKGISASTNHTLVIDFKSYQPTF